MLAASPRDVFGSSLRKCLKQARARRWVSAPLCPVPYAGLSEIEARGAKRKSILTTQFSQFSLSKSLLARLDANQFKTPTPVQAEAIPPALEGRDVLATAQTGTGKTLSFLIPIVEMLQKAEGRGAQALIVLPTRELAMQVEKAFRTIRSSHDQTVALVVGGMSEQFATRGDSQRRAGDRGHAGAA